jgi:hypothetical protein
MSSAAALFVALPRAIGAQLTKLKCWIPSHSFVTNVTPEKYRAWIELMVAANQKMIR